MFSNKNAAKMTAEDLLSTQIGAMVQAHCQSYLSEIETLKKQVVELERKKGDLAGKLVKWKKGVGEWIVRTQRK